MRTKTRVISGQEALKIKDEIKDDIDKSWLNECCVRQDKISFATGVNKVVMWIERNCESCEENPDFSIFPEKDWQDFKKQLLDLMGE